MKYQDIIAGAMAIILLLSIIAFAFVEIETPEELRLAFGVSIGWVFSRAINGANGVLKRRVLNANQSD